ncbi:Ig-like domain-containing protein [Oscillatoria sp. FACHB-1407]|uniref:VCBS domain-containing protein n=1 Tax=Oscillatoria sp. FACHB-1407 TaxID=2692847 RepID=UPI0016852BD7|nr:VCBS domain-containing protein [Oscillatoria sp. FACHB-1407]MBD2463503.1 Ig-like domain-containing protein [Oscillatoria sp. FACHB-1407]
MASPILNVSGSITASTTPQVIAAGLTIDPNGQTTLDGAQVSLGTGFVSSDRLGINGQGTAMSGTINGLSWTYNTNKGLLTLTGNASISTYEATLQQVTYYSNGAVSGNGRYIQFSLGANLVNPSNGHFYEYVSSYGSWVQAKANAESRSYFGLQGYLLTATSAQEYAFVSNKLQSNGWLGASDADVEGLWQWATGPEAGTPFWQGLSNGSSINGAYSNWAPGEPNNVGDEDYAQFLSGGQWNDLPGGNFSLPGYIVEYGGMPTDPTLQIAGSVALIVPDSIAPTATYSTQVSSTSNLVINFNEPVTKGTGFLVITKMSDGSVVETIDIASNKVTVSPDGQTITIDPSNDLIANEGYYVTIDSGAFNDLANNAFAGMSNSTTWQFTVTPPDTAPTATFSTDIDPASNLVMTFNEMVLKGTGNIVIKKSSDDSIVETINVASNQVGINGTTVTINPNTYLSNLTDYYVTIDSGTFKDLTNNVYAGVSDKTTWSFRVEDTAPPQLAHSNFESSTNNLVATFNEPITKGTGNIVVKRTSDDSVVETIGVTSGQVVLSSDGQTVTIDLTTDLAANTGYYVTVDSGAFKDVANNSYSGINDKNTWSFTAADSIPPTATFSTSVAPGGNLVITFNEPVEIEYWWDSVVIWRSDNGNFVEAFDSPEHFTLSSGNRVVTINPSVDLTEGTAYYVTIGYLFRDSSGNFYPGFGDNTTWSFTVTDVNHAAIIGGTTTGNVTEDGTLTANGSLSITDVDTGEASFVAQSSVAGTYGSFNIDTAGAWIYTADNTKLQALKAGQTVTDSFDVASVDGTTQTITITVNGANDPATIGGTTTGTVAEDGTLTANGSLSITDVDTGEASFVAQSSVAGTYGSFNVDTAGAWTYTADNTNLQALKAGQTVTDSFDVASVDGTTQTVTITVNGANDPATIGGTTTGSVTEDGTLTANGSLSITDVDTGEASFVAQSSVAGTYGSFSVDTAGAWTYTADNTKLQALKAGQTVTDSFDVASVDGTTQTITITVNGANDPAIIGGTTTGSVTEDGTLTANGTLSITDVDTGETSFVAQTGAIGTYGSFNVDTAGAWTYTADNTKLQSLKAGQTTTDSFDVASIDGTTQTITITVNGANDPATIGGTTTGSVTEDGTLTANGSLSITDVDTGEASFVAQSSVAGTYGSFNVDTAGAWIYTADNTKLQALKAGQTATDSFDVASVDGTTQTITITVNGANDPATIGGTTTGTVTEDGTLTANGSLSITDVDAGETSFVAQTGAIGTYGSFSVDTAGAWTYTADNTKLQAFKAGQTVTDSFDVASVDGTTQTITITVNGANDPATIGGTTTGTVTEDGTLTANGSLSITDVDAGETSFVAQTGAIGTYGSFNIDTAGAWTYTADNTKLQALKAGQTVTDSFDVASVDGTTQTITITVNGANDPATIGGNTTGTVTEDGTLTANGTLSITDVDTGEASFVAQSSVASTYGSFSVDTAGAWTYTADNTKLQAFKAGQTVTDSFDVASVDGITQTVTVTAVGVNDTPTVAGAIAPQVARVRELFTVTLPANTFADQDAGDTLTLSATLGDGSPLPAWLTFNANTHRFSGTPDLADAGNLSLKITATDSQGASTSNIFTLTVEQLVGELGIPTPSVFFNAQQASTTYQGTSGADTIFGTWRNDVLKGGDGNDLLKSGFAKAMFGQDWLYGEDGNDTLFGGKGNDLLDGGKGNDRLHGGSGRDLLKGGTDSDRLIGGKGNDILVGGSGNDTLTGNQGRDTFVLENLADGVDTITDFRSGDLIDLRSLLSQPQFAAVNAFVKFTQFVQLQQVGANTQIQIDTDGIGAGTATTTLAVLKNVSASNISSVQFLINN